jgi:hypothetical protein
MHPDQTLYLATFDLVRSQYMVDGSTTTSTQRIVWASSEAEARHKVEGCGRVDPYGTWIDVCNIEIHAAL